MAGTPPHDPAGAGRGDGADRGEESKLELPSLNLFRRRKRDTADVTETPVEAADPAREPVLLSDESPQPTQPSVAQPATQNPATQQPAAPEPPVSREPDQTDKPTELLPLAAQHGDEVQRTEGAEAPRKRRERKPLTLPLLDGRIAAPVTGVVVGLAGVALTYLGTQGCRAVRGTSSCGGVGLFLLIAILALMVLLGATLLKAWRISDPTSSSFLAVGLVAVLAMLFFLPYIDRWYMVIVVPVLSALTYLLSWWVTTKFIENADRA